MLATIAAAFLALIATNTPDIVEDHPIVEAMASTAQAALTESDCPSTNWAFTRDSSDGLWVVATGECERAAAFYRSPETGTWTFAIEGS